MQYGNKLIPEYANHLKTGGSLHWMIDYVKNHDDLVLQCSSERITIYRGNEELNFNLNISMADIEKKRQARKSLGREDPFYGEGYFKTRFSRSYGLLGATAPDFMVLDERNGIEFDNEREREKLIKPIHDEYFKLIRLIKSRKRKEFGDNIYFETDWTYDLSNGEYFDFIAVNKNGEILLITLIHGDLKCQIDESPIQIGLDYDAFKMLLRQKGRDYIQCALTDLLTQKQELGLLNRHWEMPELSGRIVPVLIISEPEPGKDLEKLHKNLEICRKLGDKDFLKDLRVYTFENKTPVFSDYFHSL